MSTPNPPLPVPWEPGACPQSLYPVGYTWANANGGEPVPATCAPQVYLKPEVERRIMNRLKRLEGQVRGVQRLLAAHHSCDDLLVQLGGIKQAVNGGTGQ